MHGTIAIDRSGRGGEVHSGGASGKYHHRDTISASIAVHGSYVERSYTAVCSGTGAHEGTTGSGTSSVAVAYALVAGGGTSSFPGYAAHDESSIYVHCAVRKSYGRNCTHVEPSHARSVLYVTGKGMDT